jgi:mono-ADP-ribosyltransferase sirtuin 6
MSGWRDWSYCTEAMLRGDRLAGISSGSAVVAKGRLAFDILELSMSSGYNDRLTPLKHKGLCGDPEYEDEEEQLQAKIAQLAQLISSSNHIVAFTGAGISTSSGIPDFRGPQGVWTLEMQQKPLNTSSLISFEAAQPSLTHMALLALLNAGKIQLISSQNVDGLHLKSGVPREKLAELHGNIFAEQCERCQFEFIRNYDLGAMGCDYTGRLCDRILSQESGELCQGKLRDKTIDWTTPLPESEFQKAVEHHRKADLCLCLGTSLRIRPAGNLPQRTRRKNGKAQPGKIVIVNLQETHLDSQAEIRIFARCDRVMQGVCQLLNIEIPQYIPNNSHITPSTAQHNQEQSTLPAESAGQPAAERMFQTQGKKFINDNNNISSSSSSSSSSSRNGAENNKTKKKSARKAEEPSTKHVTQKKSRAK